MEDVIEVKVIRVETPFDLPAGPLILYTSNNERDIQLWAGKRGATMVWVYKLRYTHGDSLIGAIKNTA